MEIIVNEKIKLVSVDMKYLDQHYNSVIENLNHIGIWLNWAEFYKDSGSEQSEKYIRETQEHNEKGESMEMFILIDGKVAGSCGLNKILRRNNEAEIGYWLAKEFTGKGIMTKCVYRVLKYGFEELGLHRIQIRADKGNTKSNNVIKRLGLIFEGELRESSFLHNEYHNTNIYSILKPEWDQKNNSNFYSFLNE